MAINQDILNAIISGLNAMPKKSEIDTPTNNIDLLATSTTDGLMSSSDKSKLDGVAVGANKYTHPETSGNRHIPSGGSSGEILKWESDGTAKWTSETTYGLATTSSGGLMSSTDKTNLDAAVSKLSGIAEGANNYSLPIASNSQLGGVKTTSNISDTTGLTACPIISGVPYYKDTVGSYTLPTASNTTLGGVTTTSNVTSTTGLTACPIIAGIPYYPSTLPANGGDADTLEGKHASEFVSYNVYAPIYKGDLLDITEMGTYSCHVDEVTNLPSDIFSWCYVTMTRFRDAGYRRYICSPLNMIVNDTYNILYTACESYKDSNGKLIWQRVNDGGNADTVGGHTVGCDVPANAVFTDTVPNLSLYALKSKYGDTTIDVGRKLNTTVGTYSTAEGYQTTASGNYSHAEGSLTTASGDRSHAEGNQTTASGVCSHAEGAYTTASVGYSHAEGFKTTADRYSHAEGYLTTASNAASHAGGHYNTAMRAGGSGNNTTGTAFVIGNGINSTALSNAFSIQFDGTVKAKSTITASTTADYAEFFEWLDENPDGEDRVGYFVTLEGNKIRIATNEDDYILGVVSGEPFVLGNGDCDTWNNMFLRDEFRRTIYEPAPKMVEILDSEGNPTGEFKEVEGEFEGTRPKLNPEYDHTQPYISRFDRKEWVPVGMLGVLAVRHDGTAKVNGYVTVNGDGIATACDRTTENSYRVIKSNSDSVVEIIFR